jgi:DDE superfamily endonuclease/Helix-turn-helix of DDE superfamily endonuclease
MGYMFLLTNDLLCVHCTGQPSLDPLDVDYVPTLFHHTATRKKDPCLLRQTVARLERSQARQLKKRRLEAAEGLLSLVELDEPIHIPSSDDVKCSVSTQTELTYSVLSDMFANCSATRQQNEDLVGKIIQLETSVAMSRNIISKLEKQLMNLNKCMELLSQKNENLQAENKARSPFRSDLIADSDIKTKYYTGLPNYATFRLVLENTQKHLIRTGSKLAAVDELFLTLVKLRHNPGMEDLAYRFNISVSSVTKVFHLWLDILYSTLGGLIMWPTTDRVQLPLVFRNKTFKRVRCIIDCTEIFIARPSSLKARAQTYSNYKKHNTVKLLIGISPSGCVTFLSPCWGGRASDRHITLQSNLLDKFFPGDIALADRGFTMSEDFAFQGVRLLVPAFTKGKKQLSAEEVEKSRQMSRARIHVERVIGRVKDFKILRDILPISLVKKKGQSSKSTIDKIVTVAAAIVNMNPAIL